MHRKLHSIAAAAVFIGISLFVLNKIITQGVHFSSLIQILLVLSPLFLILFSSLSPLWIGLAISSLAVYFRIPFPVFDRLDATMIFVSAVILFTMAQIAINKDIKESLFNNFHSRCMILLTIIVFARFIIDRPGSARLGGAGGAGEAAAFVLAMLCFLAFSHRASIGWDVNRNLRLVLVISTIIAVRMIIGTYSRIVSPDMPINIFSPPFWLFSAFALAWLSDRYRHAKFTSLSSPLILPAMISFTILCSFLSVQRSRPLYALAIIFIVSFSYKYFQKAAKAFFFLMLPVVIALSFYPKLIPSSMLRTLSIAIPQAKQVAEMRSAKMAGGEYGWEAGWRATLNKMAWEDIKANPLFGRGFRLPRVQIMEALYYYDKSRQGQFEGLALSGGYHNGLLTIAGFCGIPAALAFLLGLLSLSWRFLWATKNMADPKLKMFSTGILGVFAVNTGHMLLNGSGPQILVVCLLLGIMNGILYRIRVQGQEGTGEKMIDNGSSGASGRGRIMGYRS